MKINMINKQVSKGVALSSALFVTCFTGAYAGTISDHLIIAEPREDTSSWWLTDEQQLGKHLFFDQNLSEPAGQSCSSCHLPKAGFADPDSHLPVSEGVVPGRFGSRNSPSAAYAAFSPNFSYSVITGARGGQFWDGRASDLVDQAKGPFLNPVEMNNTSILSVINKVQASSYEPLFEQVCKYSAGGMDIIAGYDCIAKSIASYEKSIELNLFISKYDAFLAGWEELTKQEELGRKLFNGRAYCSSCHESDGEEHKDVFTDFSYYNLGLPRNTEFPFSSPIFAPFEKSAALKTQAVLQDILDSKTSNANPLIGKPLTSIIFDLRDKDNVLTEEKRHLLNLPYRHVRDLGLGGILNIPSENGKFKTPTLRNVELTPPYMHNGVLKTLKDVVNFYNTRDVGYPNPPEVPENMERRRVGNLGLTAEEEEAIVAYLLTLTDDRRYVQPRFSTISLPKPKPGPVILPIGNEIGLVPFSKK